MPRHTPRQTNQPRIRVEYNPVVQHELEEPQRQRAKPRLPCNLPKFHQEYSESPRLRYSISFATWLGLLSLVAFIGIAIGFTAKFLVEGSNLGLDPASADFALYKNSRFQECRARESPADAATCPDVRANLVSLGPSNYQELADHGISVVISPFIVSVNRTSTPGGDPVTYDWCEAVSCLDHSFKVVPSTPRNSAFAVTFLSVWCAIAITLFTTLWDFRQRNGAKLLQWRKTNKTDQACKALGEVAWYDWVLHVYSLCSFVWWWVSFARFVASPAYTAPPGSIGWLVPWKYAILVQYHPYSCAAANRRRPNTLSWIFNSLAFLHWIATVYVLRVNWPSITRPHLAFQSYDCATTFMAEAPGLSPCSAQQLCANPWLLTHPGFRYQDELLSSDSLVSVYFIVFTVAATFTFLSTVIALLFEVIGGRPLSMDMVKDIRKNTKFNPIVILGVASWAGGIIFGAIFTTNVIRGNSHGQEAPLTIYPACNAVHVALSPWRFYLDVDQYQKVLRLVKMWFNA